MVCLSPQRDVRCISQSGAGTWKSTGSILVAACRVLGRQAADGWNKARNERAAPAESGCECNHWLQPTANLYLEIYSKSRRWAHQEGAEHASKRDSAESSCSARQQRSSGGLPSIPTTPPCTSLPTHPLPFRSPPTARCPRHTESTTGLLNPGTDEIRRSKIPLIGAPRWRPPSTFRCDPIDEAEAK